MSINLFSVYFSNEDAAIISISIFVRAQAFSDDCSKYINRNILIIVQ